MPDAVNTNMQNCVPGPQSIEHYVKTHSNRAWQIAYQHTVLVPPNRDQEARQDALETRNAYQTKAQT